MSVCVCAKCKGPWGASGSPARCPVCGQVSFAIAIQPTSAGAKQRWQNPEYRAKQSATRKRLWQNPEYRAKVSATAKRLWQNPEYRAKVSAAHAGKHPTAETRAKISAALERRHNKEERGPGVRLINNPFPFIW